LPFDLRKIFENRSGRVIAALRVTLALIFLVSLAFEPVEPGETIADGLLLLGIYLLLAVSVLAVTWRSWWLDHRLARPMLLLDIAVFLGAVFVAEGYDADFTSPFLALFALIVLSAMLRSSWVVAARTGALTSLLFIGFGLALMAADYPMDSLRFSRRAFYMVALLLVLVWFGIDRRGAQLPPVAAPNEDDSLLDLCGTALAYAMQATGATHGLIAWADSEEPWTQIQEIRLGEEPRRWRAGPEEPDFTQLQLTGLCLFDLCAAHALILDDADQVRAVTGSITVPLAAIAGLDDGLALPFSRNHNNVLIVLGGIVAPGSDFLALGKAISREIERASERALAARLEQENAVTRARGAIARDLHDSVAQSLAGACFRLEALHREVAGTGLGAAADEIASVRDALRGEQRQVRGLIEGLRKPSTLLASHPLAVDLEHALVDAAAHWDISASFVADGPVETAGGLSHELRQLLREAVANAARHGLASTIEARLARRAGGLELIVADNGAGFADTAAKAAPWSISERISALGGQLEVVTNEAGTRLAIFLPLASPQDQTT